jgi:hypothetical protein
MCPICFCIILFWWLNLQNPNLTMALGQQLANDIYREELHKTATKHVKGVFADNRNYKIACRFHYHFYIKGLRYERTLTVLHQEFDLSETRIAQLIMAGREHLEQLKAEKADTKMLQKRFPYFSWF